MSQPSEGSQPSTAPQDQPGGSQEPARGRKRRTPAWSNAEIVDLIEVWGEASNVHDLRTSHRNAAVYSHMAASLAARGHQRSREQVRWKIKDLRQSYSRAYQPGADPEACPHFHALDRLLGAHAIPAPRDVIDPGAERPLLDTEEEEESSESQEPAASLPRTRDPRGTPQSRSPASSEAGEASTSPQPQHLGLQGTPPRLQQSPAPGQAGQPGTRRTTRGGTSGSWIDSSVSRTTGSRRTSGCAIGVWRPGGAGPCPARPPPEPAGPVPISSSPCSPLLLPPLPLLLPLLLPPHPLSLLPPPQPFPTDAPGPAVWRDGRGSRTPTPELSFPFLPSLPFPSSSLVPGFPLLSPTFIPPFPHPVMFNKQTFLFQKQVSLLYSR
ncbi:uncharacterized protein LOC142830207 [Pelodiscus sinensis]|uniref:uncharacterized protein LOC142830207 n=1 Tax=Pelodiscus sinensis TaxID=13735 RepID=UPI003F6BB139